MESPPPVLFQIQHHKHLLPQIARIHVDSIERDGVCLSFLPPFHKDSSGVDPSVLRHWEDYATQTTQDKCCLILQLDNNGKVTGVVVLTTPWSQTGPFRAGVEKLIVGPEYRRRGIAKRLMEAVEREARRLNRTLLTLGTTEGFPAVQMYPKLGWIEYGRVPEHAISPRTGERLSDIFFYKNLEQSAVASGAQN